MQHGLANLADRPQFGFGSFIKKAVKKISKPFKKIIPKEIRPFVPAVAGMFLGPAAGGILGKFGAGLAAKGGMLGGLGSLLSNPMVAGGLGRGLVDVGAQALTSDRISPVSALLSGGLGALGGYQQGVAGGPGAAMGSKGSFGIRPGTALDKVFMQGKKLGNIGNLGSDEFNLLGAAKAANIGGTLKGADDALAQQKKDAAIAGAKNAAFFEADNATRRQSIIASMLAAGFPLDVAQNAAAEEGYAMGGRVGFDMGGMPEKGGGANEEAMFDMMQKLDSGEFYIDEEGNLRRIPRKRPRMNTTPGMNEDAIAEQMLRMQMNERMGRAEGGDVPGLPEGRQVDAREGMFIPMGGAKRADDVPAMLSVNEFVLNDDAVAGLGKLMTGDPDPRAGARALYKIQDQLEAMV
jgi:hypothetical protein